MPFTFEEEFLVRKMMSMRWKRINKGIKHMITR